MAMTIALAAAELIYYLVEGAAGANVETEAVVLTVVIAAVYIGGNVVFLNSMRQRNIVGVRAGICANGAFAVGMAALLALLWPLLLPPALQLTLSNTRAMRTIHNVQQYQRLGLTQRLLGLTQRLLGPT